MKESPCQIQMDPRTLTRNPEAIHKALKKVTDGESISTIALEPCKIYIPADYADGFLADIDDEVSIIGIFGIVVGDNYGVSRACATMNIDPTSTDIVKVGGVEYLEFFFDKGNTVIKNNMLIKSGTLVYRIYNEFIALGKVPWYINMDDLAQLFDTAIYHGGANLKVNVKVIELIVSSISRQMDDKSKYHRHNPNLLTNKNIKPAFIPLKSVSRGATNTISKLIGPYFQEGVTSALVNESVRSERIDNELRA